jgi:hypothetical protein
MRKGYKPPENLSIETIPLILWRLTLATFVFLIIGGLAFIILLSLGIADPPRAGSLQWSAKTADDWSLWQETGDFRNSHAPTALPRLPFTLELTASNEGALDSGWGIWIGSWSILISREGYLSISDDEKPHWSEFLHIRRDGDNKLYLDMRENGDTTLRINDEIAWTGNISFLENAAWGVIYYRHPQINWKMVAIYAEEM